MKNYSEIFIDLFEQLKLSNLPRNKNIFINEEDEKDSAYLIFNEEEAFWSMISNYNVKINDYDVFFSTGGKDTDLNYYPINNIVNDKNLYKYICDYFIEKTNKKLQNPKIKVK
jgi:hypothetical protein